MGNLTKYLPEDSKVTQLIYDFLKKEGDAQKPRRYLGLSIIGNECDRFLWYTFRGCIKRNFSGRMYRLFDTGQREEPRFVRELRGIGCEVYEYEDEKTKKQIGVTSCAGHIRGHLDGVAIGIPEAKKAWHVLEMKTHNDKSYNALVKVGVAASKPVHFVQMNDYMHLMKIDRALYMAKNKNDDSVYTERIKVDHQKAKGSLARGKRIVTAQLPPERCTDRPDAFCCKFCDASELCWGRNTKIAVPIPAKTCQTCCHATPELDGDGRWSCDIKEPSDGDNMRGTIDNVLTDACSKHLLIPSLIQFAEVVDAGDDFIEFKNTDDGAVWRHGDGSNESSTTDDLISVAVHDE